MGDAAISLCTILNLYFCVDLEQKLNEKELDYKKIKMIKTSTLKQKSQDYGLHSLAI